MIKEESRYGDVFARRRVNGGELKLWTSLKVLLTAEPASRISHPVCFVNLILLNQLLKLSSMPWQYFIIDLYAPKRTPYIALPHFHSLLLCISIFSVMILFINIFLLWILCHSFEPRPPFYIKVWQSRRKTRNNQDISF